jgi:hypothetical protein
MISVNGLQARRVHSLPYEPIGQSQPVRQHVAYRRSCVLFVWHIVARGIPRPATPLIGRRRTVQMRGGATTLSTLSNRTSSSACSPRFGEKQCRAPDVPKCWRRSRPTKMPRQRLRSGDVSTARLRLQREQTGPVRLGVLLTSSSQRSTLLLQHRGHQRQLVGGRA